ncbi:MAG: hypothetical protein ACPLRN_04000, partial [Microgenomates group bacterium]
AGEVCPYTPEDVKGAVLDKLSSKERDPNTGQKQEPDSNTPEGVRHKETLAVAQAMREYLEINGAHIPNALLQQVYDYLSKSPLFRDLIYDKKGQIRRSDAEAIAKTLLSQPQVRAAIHRLFTERLDPSKRLKGEEAVKQLQAELKALEGQVIDINQVDSEITTVQNSIQSARTDITNDPNYSDYLDLNSQLENLNEEFHILQEAYKQAKISNPQQLQQVANDISQKRSDIRRIQLQLQETRFQNINSKLSQIESLQQQLKVLENQKNQANTPEQRQLRLQLEQKRLELQEAKVLLTAERIKYASEVIAIPSEAVKEYLDAALSETAQAYKNEAKKTAEETAAKNKELEGRAAEKLAYAISTKEKNGRHLPDKNKAQRLLDFLYQPDGLGKFIEEIAKDQTRLEAYGLTSEEANVILSRKSDPAFVEQVGKKLASSVFADYLAAGGRLSKDDLEALARVPWGQEIINNGIQVAQERREFIEKQLGKGVMNWIDEIKINHKNVKWLQEHWYTFPLGALLILLLGLKKVIKE